MPHDPRYLHWQACLRRMRSLSPDSPGFDEALTEVERAAALLEVQPLVPPPERFPPPPAGLPRFSVRLKRGKRAKPG